MKRKNILMTLLALLPLVSCVYPFSIETPEGSGSMVIDGDILIGGISGISVSVSQPLAGENVYHVPQCQVWVEAEDGKTYHGISTDNALYHVDLMNADPGVRHKLCVKNSSSGKQYESDWCEVTAAPTVERLSHRLAEDNETVELGISAHGNGKESHYRWTYTETWEYHSFYEAKFYYVPPTAKSSGYIANFTDRENIYYCWTSRPSSDIMIFDTSLQSENRFEDLDFLSIPCGDNRLSVLYHIEVYVEAINEDSYRYWNNIRTNSGSSGDLLSPMPSSMRGNIHCIGNPDENVIGYVNAAYVASAEMWIDNDKTGYYLVDRSSVDLPEAIAAEDWYSAYMYKNMRPVDLEVNITGGEDVTWAAANCVDCRLSGGTKEKPSYWPNDHI